MFHIFNGPKFGWFKLVPDPEHARFTILWVHVHQFWQVLGGQFQFDKVWSYDFVSLFNWFPNRKLCKIMTFPMAKKVIVLRNLTNDPFEFATVLFPEVELHGSVTFLATASFHEARKVLHFRHWLFPKCIDFAAYEESDSVAKPVSPSDFQSGTFWTSKVLWNVHTSRFCSGWIQHLNQSEFGRKSLIPDCLWIVTLQGSPGHSVPHPLSNLAPVDPMDPDRPVWVWLAQWRSMGRSSSAAVATMRLEVQEARILCPKWGTLSKMVRKFIGKCMEIWWNMSMTMMMVMMMMMMAVMVMVMIV